MPIVKTMAYFDGEVFTGTVTAVVQMLDYIRVVMEFPRAPDKDADMTERGFRWRPRIHGSVPQIGETYVLKYSRKTKIGRFGPFTQVGIRIIGRQEYIDSTNLFYSDGPSE